jgi:SAP domain-containing new25
MKLSASMTVTQFDHGYWYATELRDFATELGIPSASKLRKDELERAIKIFLRTGTIAQSPKRKLSAPRARDVDLGLRPDLRIVGYINNATTNHFLDREAHKLAPGLKRRSGTRYRLNRWRETQILNGVQLTYGDLVKEYVRLNSSTARFAQIPTGRYINFMSDFLAAQGGATKEQAIKAWSMLKAMDVPKTYAAWMKARSRKSK